MRDDPFRCALDESQAVLLGAKTESPAEQDRAETEPVEELLPFKPEPMEALRLRFATERQGIFDGSDGLRLIIRTDEFTGACCINTEAARQLSSAVLRRSGKTRQHRLTELVASRYQEVTGDFRLPHLDSYDQDGCPVLVLPPGNGLSAVQPARIG